jgi:mono/diheme cytochrome c family protein
VTDHRGLVSRKRAAPLAVAALVAALATASMARAAGDPGRASSRRAPERLADTGLYSDFASREVDSRNLHYTPQYPLWSDGGGKGRWIYLPPGGAIDASDPDRWVFPVGTKLWKEFAWSRRVETRYLELTPRGWIYAAYVWTEDERDAVLAPEGGVATGYEVAKGRRHEIPSVADCQSCHQGGRAEILGFSALQLSPDRDPLAPHAEPLEEGDPTLPALVQRGLLRGLPRELLDHPPRIRAASPRGRAALGYLHANCGTCHDSQGPLASLGVSLRHALGARVERDEPGAGAIGRRSRYRVASAPGESDWIRPGAPSSSAIVARMASRSPVAQMPPLATKIVDEEGLALLRRWIEEDLRPADQQSSDVTQREEVP